QQPRGRDSKCTAWTEAYVQRARAFIQSVNRRWETLEAISAYVVERQRDFVLGNRRQPAHLTRRSVAEHLQLHESTVSRAVHDKMVLLPHGRLVPFSTLFSGSAVRPEITEALRMQKERGLSDGQIV